MEIKQLIGDAQQVVDVAPHGSDVVFDGGILCQLLTDSLHRKTDEGERSAYLVYDVDKESYLRLKVSLLLFGLAVSLLLFQLVRNVFSTYYYSGAERRR